MALIIVITRGGYGDVLRFSSVTEATGHHLVVPGDAFLAQPRDVFREYSWYDLDRLLHVLGSASLTRLVKDADPGPEYSNTVRRRRVEPTTENIWETMVKVSKVPGPTNRKLKESTMAEAKAKAAPKAAAKKAVKAKIESNGAGRKSRVDEAAVIKMLKDKDGNLYGKDNNPKRAGSDSAKRFAAYKDGMTVGDYLKKSGGTPADLAWDSKHGFIKVA